MTYYQTIFTLVVPAVLLLVIAAWWLAPREQTATFRALPSRFYFPDWLVAPFLTVVAVSFLLSALGVLMSTLRGNVLGLPAGAGCLAAGIGLLLRRRFAFVVAYLLFAGQAVAHFAQMFNGRSMRTFAPLAEYKSSIFEGISHRISYVPGYLLGCPPDVTAIVVYLGFVALLALAHRKLNQQRAAGVDRVPSPAFQRRILTGFKWLGAIALLGGLAISGLGMVILMTYEERSSPGDMGGSALAVVFLVAIGVIVAVIGAIGLVVAASIKKPQQNDLEES